MSLLLFKLQLAVHLCVFLLELSANFSRKSKPIVLGIFTVFLLIGTLVLFTTVKRITPTKIEVSPALVPSSSELYIVEEYSIDQLKEKLIFWESIEKKQPSSRDVLINLSKINHVLGNSEVAEKYWKRANRLDPNFSIFK